MKLGEVRTSGPKVMMLSVLFLLVSSLVIFGPSTASGIEEISLTDEVNDVLRTGYVDTKVGGNPELDIVSLISTESISDVTIVMKCAADLEVAVGYLYTISVSGIHVSYQEGEFEVWRIGSEVQPIDNVLTDTTDDRMTVIVKKTSIVGDFRINGTTNRYVVDWTKGSTSESYYDKVGQIEEGSRAPTIGEYTKEFDDPEGDVRLIYLDMESVEEDGLDIISLRIEISDGIDLMLELGGDPLMDRTVIYTIYILDLRVIWSNGAAEMLKEGESASDLTSEMDGPIITINIPSDLVDGPPGGVVAQTRQTIDQDTYVQDLLPDDPYTISELLPFPPGSAREISLSVNGPGNVIMKRSYSGFSSQAVEDIRSSMDSDDDNNLDAGEVDEFMETTLDSILSDHVGDLKVDGRSGDLSASLQYEGLVGPVQSGKDIVITWIMNFTFEIGGAGPHKLEINIDHFNQELLPSPGIDVEGSSYKVRIAVREGWTLEPLTIEPAELANSLDIEGRSIVHLITGSEAREFDPGSIEFDFRTTSEQGDDDDITSEGGDGLMWLYIMILIIMVAVIIGITLWSRQEER